MNIRRIKENIFLLGAIDWNRRLFDSLISLPDGTSYNAYLIKGSDKTVLLDTADPATVDVLVQMLAAAIPNLKVEVIDPVLCKGLPSESVLASIDGLATTIAAKHKEQGFA